MIDRPWAEVEGRRRPRAGTPGSRRRPGRLRGAALAASAALCGACGATGASGPVPAGATPSKAARMVCSAEAAGELADALGVRAAPSTATWVDHRYGCTYSYADGRIGLSVKELGDAAATTADFAAEQAALGAGGPVAGIGQGAYQASGGSIIVRKDYKVLSVDVSAVPARFGAPPIDRSEAAVRVAIVVMGCWTDR